MAFQALAAGGFQSGFKDSKGFIMVSERVLQDSKRKGWPAKANKHEKWQWFPNAFKGLHSL